MKNSMKFTLCLACLALVCGFTAKEAAATDGINHIKLSLSDVPECITFSTGAQFPGNPIGTYTVHVEGTIGAVLGASVTIEFSSGADALIAWCVGQPHPVIGPSLTDSNGDVTFTFFGGGCVVPSQFPSQACATPVATVTVVKTTAGFPPEGFSKDIFCANSPDWVGGASSGVVPACPSTSNCVGGTTQVSVGDAIKHVTPIKLGLAEKCSKFTPPFDNAVGLDDAVFITPYIKEFGSCSCT